MSLIDQKKKNKKPNKKIMLTMTAFHDPVYSGQCGRPIVSLLVGSGLWLVPATSCPWASPGLAHVGQPEGLAELRTLQPQTVRTGWENEPLRP